MFNTPLMMPQQEIELTLDQKLKKYKDKRIQKELERALKRTGNKGNNNLFTKLQNKGE